MSRALSEPTGLFKQIIATVFHWQAALICRLQEWQEGAGEASRSWDWCPLNTPNLPDRDIHEGTLEGESGGLGIVDSSKEMSQRCSLHIFWGWWGLCQEGETIFPRPLVPIFCMADSDAGPRQDE
eukprot:692743-Pelagomonas_calceolata.AAC.3